jgi:hypothetical protein
MFTPGTNSSFALMLIKMVDKIKGIKQTIYKPSMLRHHSRNIGAFLDFSQVSRWQAPHDILILSRNGKGLRLSRKRTRQLHVTHKKDDTY